MDSTSALAQTVAISIVIGAVVAGLFTLFQIPLHKKRGATFQQNQDRELKLYSDTLSYFDDTENSRLSPLDREKLRKQIVREVQDRIRLFDSRRELAELEGRRPIS